MEPTSANQRDADDALSRAWRRALAGWLAFAAIISLAMAPTLFAMAHVWWHSATFNHGLLIPFIILWLIWDRRLLVARLMPGLYPPGLLLMAGALLLWLLGRVGDVQMVQQFGWVFLIQASVLTLLGLAVTRALLFPLGYMLFLVPFGEFLIQPLQHFTAQFIVIGLQWLDIPVFLEDVFLSTPSGDFKVAEACAGVRFLIATIALGALFANISFQSWKRRLIVVALAVIVPIIANGLRAFGIVYIAYLTDNEYAAGVDHIVYGWGFFAFITLLLLVIGMSFSDKKPSDPAFDIAKAKAVERPLPPRRRQAYVLAAALALGIAAPGYASYIINRGADQAVAALPAFSSGAGWQLMEAPTVDDWRPHYAGADAEQLVHFRHDDAIVTVYAAIYGNQDSRNEMISFGNTALAPSKHWSWLQGGIQPVTIGGVTTPAQVMRARGPYGVVRDIWQVYWVGDRLVADDKWAKIYGALAKLLNGQLAAGTVVISVQRDDPAVSKEAVLANFAAAMPAVDAYFAAAVKP